MSARRHFLLCRNRSLRALRPFLFLPKCSAELASQPSWVSLLPGVATSRALSTTGTPRFVDKLPPRRLLCFSSPNSVFSGSHTSNITTDSKQSSQKSAAHPKVRKAVLPAPGLGTRFLPATKAQPKEMLTLVDKPQIQYVVEECVASGIEHIIIVTGKGKNSIEDHFDYNPTLERYLEEKGRHDQAELVRHISDMVQVSYTRQKEPLGLGHAVLVARDLVGDEPFAVLLGDVLIPGPNSSTNQLIEV